MKKIVSSSFRIFAIYTAILLFIFGCIKEERISPIPIQEDKTLPKSMLAVVGKKRNNPYSIRNIKKAEEILSLRGSNLRIGSGENHWYVKFKPTTSDEVNLLQQDSLKLYDFPLDHELKAFPDSVSRDYSIYADGEIPELHTVVKNTYIFPNVSYDVLDTLYFPSEQEAELEYEAHLITGNIDSTIIQNSAGRQKLFGLGTKPKGFVRVLDTQKGLQPVVGAYVQVIYFGLLVGAYTNTDGYFEIDKKFLAGTNVSVEFNNGNCKIKPFDTHDNNSRLSLLAQLLLPAIHIDGWYSAGNLDNVDIKFQSNTQPRLWATMINSVYWFNKYAAQNGLKWPGKLTIYAHWAKKEGNGSAPMLRYVSGVSSVSNTVSQVLQDINSVLSTNVVGAICGDLPDITIKNNALESFNSVNITQTAFHELGHASHYVQAGNAFWAEYIRYIMKYGDKDNPYGQRSDSGSGRIALSEAWAEYVGDSFSLNFYGPAAKLSSGLSFNQKLERKTTSWIPYGIYYDMFDTYNSSEPKDNVSGFTLSQVYGYLNSDIIDPTAFRNKAKVGKSTTVQSSIDLLFSWYEY